MKHPAALLSQVGEQILERRADSPFVLHSLILEFLEERIVLFNGWMVRSDRGFFWAF